MVVSKRKSLRTTAGNSAPSQIRSAVQQPAQAFDRQERSRIARALMAWFGSIGVLIGVFACICYTLVVGTLVFVFNDKGRPPHELWQLVIRLAVLPAGLGLVLLSCFLWLAWR
jgi:hypothetical protein